MSPEGAVVVVLVSGSQPRRRHEHRRPTWFCLCTPPSLTTDWKEVFNLLLTYGFSDQIMGWT